MRLYEIFDDIKQTVEFDISHKGNSTIYEFIINGKQVKVYFNDVYHTILDDSQTIEVVLNDPNKQMIKVDFVFKVDDSTKVTGGGDGIEIFNNVIAALNHYISHTPNLLEITFTAQEENRIKLYDRMSKIISKNFSFHRIRIKNTFIGINGRLGTPRRKQIAQQTQQKPAGYGWDYR